MKLPFAVSLVVGLIMVGIGSYVALHPLWERTPVTASRITDAAFALFFLLRGALYLRAAMRTRRETRSAAPPAGPRDP